MSFHRLAGSNTGLDSVLLDAMLNSCSSTEEEILLGVAWGEEPILERLLERRDVSPLTKATSLEAALLRADPQTLRTLLTFGAQPEYVVPARLFVQEFNVLHIYEDLWSTANDVRTEREATRSARAPVKVSKLKRFQSLSSRPGSALKGMKGMGVKGVKEMGMKGMAVSSRLTPRVFGPKKDGTNEPTSEDSSRLVQTRLPRIPPQTCDKSPDMTPEAAPAAVRYEAPPDSALDAASGLALDAASGLAPDAASDVASDGPQGLRRGWTRILAEAVDGYKFHLQARASMLPAGGNIKPTWTDLFLWSAISGRNSAPLPMELCMLLWRECRHPLRATLMASQFCRRSAATQSVHKDGCLARSAAFEDHALALLDAIPDSEVAQQVLLLVPQQVSK